MSRSSAASPRVALTPSAPTATATNCHLLPQTSAATAPIPPRIAVVRLERRLGNATPCLRRARPSPRCGFCKWVMDEHLLPPNPFPCSLTILVRVTSPAALPQKLENGASPCLPRLRAGAQSPDERTSDRGPVHLDKPGRLGDPNPHRASKVLPRHHSVEARSVPLLTLPVGLFQQEVCPVPLGKGRANITDVEPSKDAH